ncbi:hypothetical protein SKAU_G00070570 [Synaphobranchus kaupii]|uniref:BEN domain-containing protein n=1 Tax=Synaphobranchus kaupii TaxID=118154 RepID=A0A9Q1G6Q2_SYNKA|nr:hypothetical protein SKAU_G00070570 [Synaphobranchus kaupii]
MVTLSGGLRLKKALLSPINSASYQRYTAELLVIVFGRDMLASHSLNGRKASNKGDNVVKDSLPAETVGQIIEHVRSKFAVEPGLVRAAIRTKLNNEDKMRKRRVLE